MQPNVGDKVKIINDTLEGTISQILSDKKVVVAADDGFEYTFHLNEIVVVRGEETIPFTDDDLKFSKLKTSTTASKAPLKSVLDKYRRNVNYPFTKTLEIDLHLEELVEFPGKLEPWQKIFVQMQHFKNCLQAAIDEEEKRLVVIHGKGQGILKTEIINYLATLDDISYKDADYRTYGYGATEIIIK